MCIPQFTFMLCHQLHIQYSFQFNHDIIYSSTQIKLFRTAASPTESSSSLTVTMICSSIPSDKLMTNWPRKCMRAIISKSVRNWHPKMPKTNFNKVLTLWTCQTYMENMSSTLKPDEISFGVLFFWHKLRQFRTFLKLGQATVND